MGSDKDCGWEGNRRFDHVLRILTACIFMCKFNDIQEGHEHLAYGSHTWYSILFFIFWLTCAYAATSHYYVVCVTSRRGLMHIQVWAMLQTSLYGVRSSESFAITWPANVDRPQWDVPVSLLIGSVVLTQYRRVLALLSDRRHQHENL